MGILHLLGLLSHLQHPLYHVQTDHQDPLPYHAQLLSQHYLYLLRYPQNLLCPRSPHSPTSMGSMGSLTEVVGTFLIIPAIIGTSARMTVITVTMTTDRKRINLILGKIRNHKTTAADVLIPRYPAFLNLYHLQIQKRRRHRQVLSS
jgi:hypothetical protein